MWSKLIAEDSDWGNKAMIGGGVAAAGGWLLITGRNSGTAPSARPGRFGVRHTIRF